jgi:hypothetical protein
MVNSVKKFLKEQEWEFSKSDKGNIFTFGVSLENGNFQCLIDVNPEREQLMIYSFCGSNCPIKKIPSLTEILNKINYQLFLGSFEVDPEDGEVRFKTSTYFDNIKPSSGFVASYVIPNIFAMDKHLPIIMRFIHDGVTKKEALKSIEDLE